MKNRSWRASAVGVLALLAGRAGATDRWEGGLFCNDDTAETCNDVAHGTVQIGHDFQFSGTDDEDWMATRVQVGHSYEARVRGAGTLWDGPTCPNGCGNLARVNAAGTVLTAGVAQGPPVGPDSDWVGSLVVGWVSTVTGKELIRMRGFPATAYTAADQYEFSFLDTTYFAPRFNNSASQVTVLIVQNTRDVAVTGTISFYNAAGTQLTTTALLLPARGTQVTNTAGITALQGQSGSIAVAHSGGYGALSGKAVAVEAATGFTFDTPLAPIPY
jgi:hypothetical protein